MDKGLYNRLEGLQKHLGNFAMSLTLNKEDAEDLMQETNLKVLDNHDNMLTTPISKVGFLPLCATSLSITIVAQPAARR